jgi:hypothetical protein
MSCVRETRVLTERHPMQPSFQAVPNLRLVGSSNVDQFIMAQKDRRQIATLTWAQQSRVGPSKT